MVVGNGPRSLIGGNIGTIRWGLCCQFLEAPIRFRTATHRYVSGLDPSRRREYLIGIALDNATALREAAECCHALGTGAFRINSQLLPLATHPESGYTIDSLDPSGGVHAALADAGARAAALGIRLSFHPDQFIVLNSARDVVVASAVTELAHQAALAAVIGANTIVVHGGGASGGIAAALERLERGIERLDAVARARLVLENDDRHFAPLDLLPVCERTELPLVYDVHHHRCRPDGLSVGEATALAAGTWRGGEQWAHISSPRGGWDTADSRPHADYVDPADFPESWRERTMTIDVEAKAKERAVLALRDAVDGAVTPPSERPAPDGD